MSHQTGIKSNDDLKRFFAQAKDGRIRVIKVAINNSEQLTLDSYKEASGDWTQDYNDCILKLTDSKLPCYFFYRLDEQMENTGYAWLFISWSPDSASVKHKMLYAATKSTLKTEFGAGQIKDEIFGTAREDVSLEGYLRHIKSQLAPKPMTFREEEMEFLKQTETKTNINVDTKHKTMQGVMFPIEENALSVLQKFQKQSVDYVQLYIDIVGEKILMDHSRDKLGVQEMCREIPSDKGRFHLYRYEHDFDGEQFKSVIFIYSMPGFALPIKERMLYSCCRNELISYLKAQIGIEICKTLEISEAGEISETFLNDEIHPKKVTTANKFEKPKGPTARGPRRITKPASNE